MSFFFSPEVKKAATQNPVNRIGERKKPEGKEKERYNSGYNRCYIFLFLASLSGLPVRWRCSV
jgi:hypothetical protein